MTSLTSTNSGVVLSTSSYGNPILIASEVTVRNAGIAIEGAGQAWSIANSGLVRAYADEFGTYAYAIDLENGGTVTNEGSGTIIATYGGSLCEGVRIDGAPGDVVNYSYIYADGNSGVGIDLVQGGTVSNESGAYIYAGGNAVQIKSGAGTVTNAGGIYATATGNGIVLGDGGTVDNQVGGYVFGRIGIVLQGASSVLTNEGTIVGANDGIQVSAADTTITNAGSIDIASTDSHDTVGIDADSTASGLAITNTAAGTVSATGSAIHLQAAGATISNAGLLESAYGVALDALAGSDDLVITNQAGGTIVASASNAISIYGTDTTLTNQGTIKGIAPSVGNGTGSGIYVDTAASGVTVTNELGGTIAGYYGVLMSGAGGVLLNQGGIGGDVLGVGFGYADTGFTFTNAQSGTVSGLTGIGVYVDQGTVLNGGTVSGVAAVYGGSSATNLVVTNEASGTIDGMYYGVQVEGSDATITNQGVIDSTGTGTHNAGIYVDSAAISANVTNEADATISGFRGLYIGASGVTLTNDGTIVGQGTTNAAGAIYTESAATSLQVVNALGATLSGYYGAFLGGDQTTITNDGVILGTLAGGAGIDTFDSNTGMAVYNATGATISGDNYGVYLGGYYATLTNAGTISALTNAAFATSGTGTNAFVSNASTGVITGPTGVALFNANDTVINQGTITGTGGTYPGAIYVGDSAANAVIINEAGGTIDGSSGIYVDTANDTISNAGSLGGIHAGTAASGLQVTNAAGGTIGGSYGIELSGAGTTIDNAGIIHLDGYSGGVYTDSDESGLVLTNETGGTISSQDGVKLEGSNDTVLNAGDIASVGSEPEYGIGARGAGLTVHNEAGGTIAGQSDGIYTEYDSTITNQSGGLITGSTGLRAGSVTSLVNAGIIEGTDGFGGRLEGGTADNQSGATISGGYGLYSFEDASITNQGVIIGTSAVGLGIDAGNFAVVNNLADADVSGATDGVVLFGYTISVDNAGTIAGSGHDGLSAKDAGGGATITNASGGTITGGRDGIYVANSNAQITNVGLISGGNETAGAGIWDATDAEGFFIDNQAGGTITGSLESAIYIHGSHATITNDGLVADAHYTAIYLTSLTNHVAVANNADGTISGNGGIVSYSEGSQLTNAGLIDGSFTGVDLGNAASGAVLANEAGGTIIGQGGAGGTVQTSAIVVYANNASITNQGLVQAIGGQVPQFGIYATLAAGLVVNNEVGGTIVASGTGIAMQDGTVTNAAGAVISGAAGVIATGATTLTNAGTIIGTGGTAVELGVSASGQLIIDPGARFEGLVDGGPTTSTLELASGADAGTLSGLGVNYVDFSSITIDSGADWTLDGTPGVLGAGTSITNFGTVDLLGTTLADTGGMENDGFFTIDPSNLFLGSLTGTGTVAIDAGSTLSVAGIIDAGQTLTFTGNTGGALLQAQTGTLLLGTVSNFGPGDIIDLGDFGFVSGSTTASVAGNVLTVTNGTLTDTFATAGLADGTALVTYADQGVGTDIVLAGPAAPSLALDPASDSGVSGDHLTSDATPVLTGTGEAGDTVTLYDGDSVVGSAVVASDGTWSITSDTLANGLHHLSAVQTNGLAQPSPHTVAYDLTIQTAPPDAPLLVLAPSSDTGVAGDDVTSDTIPVIAGTGEAGAVVTLYDGATAIGSATVLQDGTWSITTPFLADGVHDLTATQTSTSDLVSPASTALALTIDTTAPDAPPAIDDPSTLAAPGEPVVTGSAEALSTVTLYSDGALVGTASVDASGAWTYAFTTPLPVGSHVLTATDTDAAGNASALSAPATVEIGASGGYTFVSAPDLSGHVTSRIHDSTGLVTQVDTSNTSGQLLQSVSNTQAILEIYDDEGRLIGTITQPSMSALVQPIFATSGLPLSATTGSGPIGSVIDLLAESNVIHSQGNDTVNAGPGADTIFASGAISLVRGGSGTLVYVGGMGSSTITGGTGSSTVFGGSGGGLIEGGTGGHNALVAGGGSSTIFGGGAGDTLVGGSGQNLEVMQQDGVAFGGAGVSSIFGASGGTLVAGSGNDVLVSGDGPEALWGGSGNATLFGGSGPDTLAGGASGNSTLVAGSGNTAFVGGGGTSQMFGGAGNDTFYGGTGSAVVVEGRGDDEVLLGHGTMSVYGGTGTDLYDVVPGAADGGNTIITGFKSGVDELRFFGSISPQDVQQSVVGGSTMFKLTDGATITLAGVTTLAPSSVVI